MRNCSKTCGLEASKGGCFDFKFFRAGIIEPAKVGRMELADTGSIVSVIALDAPGTLAQVWKLKPILTPNRERFMNGMISGER